MSSDIPGGQERAASARRFAALRSLGRQDHLGEVQRALQASITALEEHEREIPFALALLLDASGNAHLVASYGVDLATIPRGPFTVAERPWLHVRNDRSVVELPGVSVAFSSGLEGTPRAFVARMHEDDRARAVVSSLVTMGAALDVAVVAEGVETQEQAQSLARTGCHLAQGYWWSRPVPDEDFVAFVAGRVAAVAAG